MESAYGVMVEFGAVAGAGNIEGEQGDELPHGVMDVGTRINENEGSRPLATMSTPPGP